MTYRFAPDSAPLTLRCAGSPPKPFEKKIGRTPLAYLTTLIGALQRMVRSHGHTLTLFLIKSQITIVATRQMPPKTAAVV